MFNPAGNVSGEDGDTVETLINLAGNAKYQGQFYGGILIANIFVYKMRKKKDAIKLFREKGLAESFGGSINSRHLDLMASQSSGRVLLAWGDLEPDMKPYADDIITQLCALGRDFCCLGMTENNQPRHPGDWNVAQRFEPFPAGT